MDFISALLIIGVAHGLFTLSLLFLRGGTARQANMVLAVIILFLIWLQSEFLSIRWPHNVGAMLFYGTRYGSWLVLGPLFLLYVRSISTTGIKPGFLVHFAPFVILWLIVPMLYSIRLSRYQVDYGMLNVFNDYGFVYTTIQWFYSGVFIFQFIHFTVYIFISLRALNKTEIQVKEGYSGDPVANVRWLKKFAWYLVIAMVFVIGFLFILFFTKAYTRMTDYIYVLPLTFVTYAISYKLAKARWPSADLAESTEKYAKSSLSPEKAQQYRSMLEKFMSEEKPYMNNGLKLNDLSVSLNIPSHHLSRVVNESIGKSFFDYVNEKRVMEAKRMIDDSNDMTLLEIAFKAGFNNKNSFTNAFKKNVGMTPSSYKQSINHSSN